jgi:hypothetical protein
MKKYIKYCLLVLTLVVLLLPLLQDYVFKFKIKALYGVLFWTPKPEMTFQTLYSGHYQTQIEKYISENFGFREPTIRFYNQYLWDFYRKTPVEYVVKGKDGWLYFIQNVNEYYGTEIYRWYDTSDEARTALERKARIMNKLRLVLKDYGIEFMAFEAPEKGFLYSEFLPDRERDTTSISATDFFNGKFSEYGFPFIGMTGLYERIKDTVDYPLFTKYGFHWNISCVYGADTLFRMMESVTGKDMPHLHLVNFHPYDKNDYENHKIDFDIEQNLNLMRQMAYGDGQTPLMADVVIKTDSTYVKPNMFFIGDSFLWRIHDLVDFHQVFGDTRFWYYGSTAYYGDNITKMRPAADFDQLREIFKSDFIVLFSHGSQIHKFSYGFAEKALFDLCVPDSIMDREAKRISDSAGVSIKEAKKMIFIDPELIPELRGEDAPTIRNTKKIAMAQTMNRIENDGEWLQALKVEAAKEHAVIDSVIRHEALNVIDGKPLMRDGIIISDSLLNQYDSLLYQYEINAIVESIKLNPTLMQDIRQKAKKNNRPFEEQLLRDAEWIYDYNKNNQ